MIINFDYPGFNQTTSTSDISDQLLQPLSARKPYQSALTNLNPKLSLFRTPHIQPPNLYPPDFHPLSHHLDNFQSSLQPSSAEIHHQPTLNSLTPYCLLFLYPKSLKLTNHPPTQPPATHLTTTTILFISRNNVQIARTLFWDFFSSSLNHHLITSLQPNLLFSSHFSD